MCHRPDVFIKEVLNKPKHFTARKKLDLPHSHPLSLSSALLLPLSLPLCQCLSASSIKTTGAHLKTLLFTDRKFDFDIFSLSPVGAPAITVLSLSLPLSLPLIHSVLTTV